MKRISGTGNEVGQGIPVEAVTADMCALRDSLNGILIELSQIKELIKDSVDEARTNTAALLEAGDSLTETTKALREAFERSNQS